MARCKLQWQRDDGKHYLKRVFKWWSSVIIFTGFEYPPKFCLFVIVSTRHVLLGLQRLLNHLVYHLLLRAKLLLHGLVALVCLVHTHSRLLPRNYLVEFNLRVIVSLDLVKFCLHGWYFVIRLLHTLRCRMNGVVPMSSVLPWSSIVIITANELFFLSLVCLSDVGCVLIKIECTCLVCGCSSKCLVLELLSHHFVFVFLHHLLYECCIELVIINCCIRLHLIGRQRWIIFMGHRNLLLMTWN